MDFLKFYLSEQPTMENLEPFLETSETILKVTNELFEYFPREFREQLVQKITSKDEAKSKDAIEIVKKSGGNEIWLLRNGGDGWVDVMKNKRNRSDDLK